MLDNLYSRYSVYLTPWNILQNYYIRKTKDNNYSLDDGLFENLISNEKDFEKINSRIQVELKKLKDKWFEIINKPKSELNINKLFEIKFNLKWKKLDIYNLETDNYNYYITDINQYNSHNKLITERYVLFFSKWLNEFIWRFIITIIDNVVSIWSMFISTSKQRQWHLTNIMIYDIYKFLPKNTKTIDVYSILKKWVWFYQKMEKLWRFKFTKWDSDGVFYI